MRFAIVAGEASGDALAAPLIAELRHRLPGATFVGIGGPKMQSAGLDSWYSMDTLAVRGYAEAIKSVPRILGIRRELTRRLLAEKPDIFIGVDAPDFNLGLEKRLRRAGVATVHYVSPSIWAWRGGRIHGIKRAVDHMLALFPLEVPIYQKAGVPVTYVGHPYADATPEFPDRDAAREQFKLSPVSPVIALLPGSRMGELHAHAEVFLRTAQLIHESAPEIRFLVPLVSRATRVVFEEVQARLGLHDLPLTILFAHADLALTAADVALVASGTATLEAALLRCPMVITYRVPKMTWYLMWPRRYLPYIGLPNVLAGEFIVPEVLQDDATPENLSQALLNQLRDKLVRERQVERFESIYHQLKQGAAQRAADAVIAVLQTRSQRGAKFTLAAT